MQSKIRLALFCLVLLALVTGAVLAQEPTQVARPQPLGWSPSPSATTTSVKWFHYSEYLEQVLALRTAEIAALKAAAVAPTVDASQVFTKLTAIETLLKPRSVVVTPDPLPPLLPGQFRVGQRRTLTATAEGYSLTWQWSKNGTPISGATAAVYTIASATAADAGTYTARASNSTGHAEASVTLTLVP